MQELLNAIQLPKHLAICKCEAHRRETDDESRGNDLADKAAKAAADNITLIADTELQSRHKLAPTAEKDMWIKKGAKLVNGIYIGPDEKNWLPRSLFEWAAKASHGRNW